MRWLMPLVLFPIRLAMGYQFQSVASTATQFVHMSVVGLGWTLFNASLIVFVSFAPDMLVQLGHEPGAARTIASLVI